MLSMWRKKPEPAAAMEQGFPGPIRRKQQQNIKVSEDCSQAFAALAKALGISKAALFEDMVAERLESLRRRGFVLGKSES